MNDTETDAVTVGEIGGGMESRSLPTISNQPVIKSGGWFYCRTNGRSRAPHRHAGAIVGGADDTAAAKMKIMAECGSSRRSKPG